MEIFKNNPENKRRDLEQEVNHESNDSVLLLERLSNPQIKQQILDLVRAYYDKVNTEFELNLDNKNEVIEKVSKLFDGNLLEAKNKTDIDIWGSTPSRHDPVSGETVISLNNDKTSKQMSITEAHEKGHQIRGFIFGGEHFFGIEKFLRNYFSSAFDWGKMDYPREDYLDDLKRFEKSNQEEFFGETRTPDTSYDGFRKRRIDYLSDPKEIIERMSQLKNYFGMKADEVFTKEHLLYAQRNYVKDTGYDNNMTEFLSSITPETEDEFVRLINSSGV